MTETATLAPPPAGHNKPPEPDPFEVLSARADDLYLETGNFADGAEIQNEAEFQAVQRLINEWKTFAEACVAIRDELKAPHSAKVTAIQEQFYPLIGETQKVTGIAVRAKKVLLEAKTKWGNKQNALREAEAKRLRDEAAKQAQEAAAAAQEAAGNLEATEQAEELFRGAQATARAATQAEAPAVKGLRDHWTICGFAPVTEPDGKVTDGETALLRHMWKVNKPGLVEAALRLAEIDVRNGRRAIPGLLIENHRRAV